MVLRINMVSGAPACSRGVRMWAWRVHSYGAGGAAELRLEKARVPPLRAPDDVLVAVRAASINPLDIAMIGGYGSRILNTLRNLEDTDVEFPLVLGRDFVGEVVRSGPACRLRPGDRVWGVVPPHRPGSHAQFVLVKDAWAGLAPGSLDDRSAGGALYAALSACAALRAAGLHEPRSGCNPRVLLLGLGGVGQAALQLLVNNGAHVVVGCSGDVCAQAIGLGAAVTLDRNSPEYDRLLEESGPYEAIIDCAGAGGSEASARRWRFGRYVTLSSPLLRETDARGLAPGAVAAAGTLLAQSVAAARVSSSPSGGCPSHVRWAFFRPSTDDIELLRRLTETGKWGVEVEQVFPWWEGARAFERAAQGHARGKLVVDFSAKR